MTIKILFYAKSSKTLLLQNQLRASNQKSMEPPRITKWNGLLWDFFVMEKLSDQIKGGLKNKIINQTLLSSVSSAILS